MLAPIVPENMRARAITAEVWEARIVPQIVKYMRSDAYYRSNGSPMIVDFWLPLQDRKTAYAVLRREVLSSIGVNPTIILLVGGRPAYRDLFFQSVTGPNGFTCFNMGTTKPDEPYAALVAEWAQMMKTQIAAPGKPPDRSSHLPSMRNTRHRRQAVGGSGKSSLCHRLKSGSVSPPSGGDKSLHR